MDYYQAALAKVHAQLLDHATTKEFLSCERVRFNGSKLEASALYAFEDPLNTSLSGLAFAHLFSVFNGSRVVMQPENTVGPDEAPPGLYFTVINNSLIKSGHKNKFGLILNGTNAELFVVDLFIDHFFLNEHKTAPGLGTIAFALCAINAHSIGLKNISLIAAGGVGFDQKHVGYDVWPKFGFDAKLLDEDGVHSVQELQHCDTVQELIAINPGWWTQNGSQRLMVFDLAPDSISWRKLLSYLHAKFGI